MTFVFDFANPDVVDDLDDPDAGVGVFAAARADEIASLRVPAPSPAPAPAPRRALRGGAAPALTLGGAINVCTARLYHRGHIAETAS